jgi:hypothetical protein
VGGLQTTGGACSEADAAKKQPALIDTQELRQLLTTNAKPLFVDVRPTSDYAVGRINRDSSGDQEDPLRVCERFSLTR